jgi:hypothetical protein
MATTTPNFGWPVPTSTDLVKDGATAIEALGDAIDASLVDLEGGTTGQILAKASNADMDFAWITNDVGDITAVTAGTGITGGGTSGAVTVSFDQANFGGGQFAAGKNKIINGAFNVWQRGTSATVPIANNSFSGPDRFQFSRNGSGSVVTVSRQAFTPGTAPVAGYEGNYFMRFNQTTAGTGGSYNQIITRMEDVTTYAGQTVTFSFWAKADSSRTLAVPVLNQNFGAGGSSQVGTNITLNSSALTTAWTRYTGTVTLPSISGKTIGTSSYLEIDLGTFLNTTFTFDTWGWMLESGSTATPFQTATGTLQGELSAAQRYYQRFGAKNGQTVGTNATYGTGFTTSTTGVNITVPFPVTMRITPTAIEYASITAYDAALTQYTPSAVALVAGQSGLDAGNVQFTVTGATAARAAVIIQSATTGYLAFSAEL